jgi:hypothetical protein
VEEAAASVSAALELLPGREVWASYAWADLAIALEACGLPFPETQASSRWIDAARAFVSGDFAGAAECYAEIGSKPDEAHARERSAASLRSS